MYQISESELLFLVSLLKEHRQPCEPSEEDLEQGIEILEAIHSKPKMEVV